MPVIPPSAPMQNRLAERVRKLAAEYEAEHRDWAKEGRDHKATFRQAMRATGRVDTPMPEVPRVINLQLENSDANSEQEAQRPSDPAPGGYEAAGGATGTAVPCVPRA